MLFIFLKRVNATLCRVLDVSFDKGTQRFSNMQVHSLSFSLSWEPNFREHVRDTFAEQQTCSSLAHISAPITCEPSPNTQLDSIA